MVRIVTDTTACLPSEIAGKYQIPIIPQIINFGDKSYLEGIEIDQETFLKRLKTEAELPKTAAPPPELFAQEFRRLVPLGETILCIHPSAEVSGTVRSATVAAREFPQADIRVIDTRLIAGPLAKMVELAAVWAASGEDADTIEARLKELTPRCHIYFLVATLEYLIKGGRIGGASALLGSVLQIKPILCLKDGRVETFEKARTHKRALARLMEIVVGNLPQGEQSHLIVMHADVPDQAHQFAAELKALLNLSDIPVSVLPPAIVVHAGPGVLAVSFFDTK
ncbi:MAG: DegV family protein [Anaerolineales bacterium]